LKTNSKKSLKNRMNFEAISISYINNVEFMEFNALKFKNLIAFADKRIFGNRIHKIWSDCIINYTIVWNDCFAGIVCSSLGYCKK
jgi:hypothetical protein